MRKNKRSSIAEEICRMRNHKQWTQAEFADAIGTNRVSISQYENGHTVPSLKSIRKIKEFARKHRIDYDEEVFRR